jgi:subtilisin family serine protease
MRCTRLPLVSLGVLLLVAAALLAPAPARAAADSMVPAEVRDEVRLEGTARVIVELRLPAGPHVAEGRQGPAAVSAQRRDIAAVRTRVVDRLRAHPHRVVHRPQTVPLLAVEVGDAALRELEAAPLLVTRVYLDRLHRPSLAESVPLIGADLAWGLGFDGTGTVVAVIDTGVRKTHPFLTGKVVEEACYSTTTPTRSTTLCPNGLDEQTGPGSAPDCSLEGCWHGTHVAGIAAGNGATAGVGFSGVARGAHVMAVQVFSRFTRFADCGGAPPCVAAYTSDIIAALERVYALRATHNFAAVNMSLGGGSFDSPCDTDPVKSIIDNLRSVEIATVVASGNGGSPTALSSPACVSSAVSVGATTKTDEIAEYSNIAPFLSLLAPGDAIVSSVAPSGFGIASGTSMAAPHVAGAWAVLKQAVPGASVDSILTALQETGQPVEDLLGEFHPRIRVDLALQALLNPGAPIVGSVSPSSGTRGTTVGVTLGGLNFETGATVDFGAGIAVSGVTVVSTSSLSATLTISAGAALGARSVTVTNPGGGSSTRANAFTVIPPPPALSLAFVGKARDRVGQGSTALVPDGALDGTFKVMVQPGSGARTVTQLQLRRSDGSGIWDTLVDTGYWALGAASTLSGALLNASNASVSFPVSDGSSFYLFGADLSASLFSAGASFTLTAKLADGSTATVATVVPALVTVTGVTPGQGSRGTSLTVTVAGSGFTAGAAASFGAGITVTGTTVTSSSQLSVGLAIDAAAALGPRDVSVTNGDGQVAVKTGAFGVIATPASVSLAWVGKVRDRVGQGNTALGADGAMDGAFVLSVGAGSGARTITQLELRRSDSAGIWDTAIASPYWVLGVAAGLDAGLLNAGNASVSIAVTDGSALHVFASDVSPSLFGAGGSFTVTAQFSDGSSASASATIVPPPGPSVTLAWVGKARDRVGQGTVALGADGAQDGAFVLTMGAGSGARTISQLELRRSDGAGIWDTSASSAYWILGAAAGLDGALLNAGDGSVSIAVTGGTAIHVFASDVTPTLFATGGSFTITARFADGSSATASATVTPPAGPSLAMTWVGKARDRVGQGNTDLSGDGQLDGTFQITVGAGSGARTVTALELRRSDGGGIWDTQLATGYWVVGVAAGLDAPLLNSPSSAAVSIPVVDGSALHLFVSDWSGSLFGSGRTFTVTAQFADGAVGTATVTIP